MVATTVCSKHEQKHVNVLTVGLNVFLQNTLSANAADIIEEMECQRKRLKERDDAGYGTDVSTTDRSTFEANEKEFNREIIDAFISTSGARRRRAS